MLRTAFSNCSPSGLKSSDADLGSKRLQLNEGGCATPFLLRDLDSGDVISIPTTGGVLAAEVRELAGVQMVNRPRI
jgi:hypothetical protein